MFFKGEFLFKRGIIMSVKHIKRPYNADSISLGKALRQLREERNYTLIEVERMGLVSSSTLSNIENGKSDVTLTMLFNILESLNVPLEVVLPYFGSVPGNYKEYFTLIENAYSDGQVEALNYYSSFFKTYEKRSQAFYLIRCLSQLYLSSLDGKFNKKEEYKQKINTYFSTDFKLDYFSMILFTESLILFEPDFSESKIHLVEKKLNRLSDVGMMKQEYITLLLNIIEFYIIHFNNDALNYWIKKAEEKLKGSFFAFEQEKLNYFKGIVLSSNSKSDEGEELIRKVMENFDYYGWSKSSLRIRKELA